jgi:hypothetical protein
VLRQPTGLRDRQAQCIRRHRRRTRRSGVAIRPLPPSPPPRASDCRKPTNWASNLVFKGLLRSTFTGAAGLFHRGADDARLIKCANMFLMHRELWECVYLYLAAITKTLPELFEHRLK